MFLISLSNCSEMKTCSKIKANYECVAWDLNYEYWVKGKLFYLKLWWELPCRITQKYWTKKLIAKHLFFRLSEIMFTFGLKCTVGKFTQTKLKRCHCPLFHLFLPTYSVNCTNVLNSTMCMYRCMHRMSGNHPRFRVRDVRA